MNENKRTPWPTAAACALALLLCAGISTRAAAQAATAVTALPSLNIPAYMGTWYQVAWFPNRFQKQCVSDTSASYRLLPSGDVEVTNRCRVAGGGIDRVVGLARPAGATVRGSQLEPAQLEVSFLPTWLRWLPIWGAYWVLDLAPDGRYAVVSEPSKEYLWVLARAPVLAPVDETAIRSRLSLLGFDLGRWQTHPHGASAPVAQAPAAAFGTGAQATMPTPSITTPWAVHALVRRQPAPCAAPVNPLLTTAESPTPC